MIIYFSGTGNSEYVANEIGKAIDDEVFNLFSKIRDEDYSTISSDKPWIVVVPTYAWRIPRIVETWLKKTTLTGHKDIYFVMTCAGAIGNAGKYIEKLCHSKQMVYQGTYQIIMPENYLALFNSSDKDEAISIIEKAKPQILKTIEIIKYKKKHLETKTGIKGCLNSSIVNEIFYPLFVHAKKFHVTDACIKCGKCKNLCPLNNISIQQGKPVWSDKCTHCMACINRCPKQAIEYGKHTKGKPRYVFPSEDITNIQNRNR